MKNEFLSYEQSLALKELGFDESALSFYLDNELKETLGVDIGFIKTVNFDSEVISAPLMQQAFRFFREKYDLHALTSPLLAGEWSVVIDCTKTSMQVYWSKALGYEEAEQACLDKLIELAKESKQ